MMSKLVLFMEDSVPTLFFVEIVDIEIPTVLDQRTRVVGARSGVDGYGSEFEGSPLVLPVPLPVEVEDVQQGETVLPARQTHQHLVPLLATAAHYSPGGRDPP